MTRLPTARTTSALLLAVALGASQVAGASDGQEIRIRTGGAVTADISEMMVSGGPAGPMEVGTGVIVGRVVEADANTPVAGTIVTLSVGGFTPLRVLTDGQGRFAFRALPKGSFSITATRPGFVDGAHGRLQPGGTAQTVDLTDDQRTGNVDILVWRHAAVAGTVLDENNDPLVGAPVRALRRDYSGGRQRLVEAGSDSTDDRGQYRISSLEPGDYVIALPMTQRPSVDSLLSDIREGPLPGGGGGGTAVFAMRVERSGSESSAPMVFSINDGSGVPPAGYDADGQPLTYQTEFFTGALSASAATLIPLAAGEERGGADFRLTPVRALSISGMVIGPDGPAANTQLQLIPADAEDLVSPIETATATTNANGQFEFTGVPSGQYTLRAQRTPRFFGGPGQNVSFTSISGAQMQITTQRVVTRPGGAAPLPTEPTLWAETPISVGRGSLAGLSVALREGLTVSGQVAFQGAATPPTPEARSNISLTLVPADGRTADLTAIARGRVDETGGFKTVGVPAGKYILRVAGAPQGWTLHSATFGGRDITSTAVELKTDNAAGVVLSFTDRPSELNGTVRDSSGNPDTTASVIVFPTDRSAWVDTGSQPRKLHTSRTSRDGSFKIGPLPPGDYHVVAIEGSAPRSWQDPAWLDAVARASTAVRLGEGDTRVITLTSSKGPA